jgi:beta-fructofuranosidase
MRKPKRSSDFAPSNKHILLLSVSHNDQTQYTISLVGTYINYMFLPERQDMLDGGCFYAPQAVIDERGRRIMWGWLREGRDNAEQLAAGWSGVMSLPRLFSLRLDNVLDVRPAPELTLLRGKQTHYSDLALVPSAPTMLPDVRGDALEIIATFEPGDADSFGVLVRCSPDLRETTRIEYNSQLKHIAIDRSRSSLNEAVEHHEQSTLCELAAHERVTLHIFLDHSVIEIFVNNQVCLSSRIYPTLTESVGVGLFANSDKARLTVFDMWEMASLSA